MAKKKARKIPVKHVRLHPKTVLRVVAPEGVRPVVAVVDNVVEIAPVPHKETWWEYLFGIKPGHI